MFENSPNNLLAFLVPYGIWFALVVVILIMAFLFYANIHRDWSLKTKVAVKLAYELFVLVAVMGGVALLFRWDVSIDGIMLYRFLLYLGVVALTGIFTALMVGLFIFVAFNVTETVEEQEMKLADILWGKKTGAA